VFVPDGAVFTGGERQTDGPAPTAFAGDLGLGKRLKNSKNTNNFIQSHEMGETHGMDGIGWDGLRGGGEGWWGGVGEEWGAARGQKGGGGVLITCGFSGYGKGFKEFNSLRGNG
jgi:hypothetical protein